MSNDISGKNSISQKTPTLAYDTRVLPPEILTGEEIGILHGINNLLEYVQKHSSSTRTEDPLCKKSPWANPEGDRRNNVIMIDGRRGAGKTSLLLTLLKGWSRPETFESIGKKEEFQKMKEIVRALDSIDFDPLPPELPIYNWIIQAFHPLVQMVGDKNVLGFMEPSEHEEIDDTLSGKYRALHHAAAVGWTTGLLRQELKRDGDDFLLWQNEQQLTWQALRSKWQEFLDKLLQKLENTSQNDCDERLPPGGIIVLPIDDLDLQVERTRELLLAIRVLRHNRLAYILTGNTKGTDLALKASFYRDFTLKVTGMTESLQDEIEESTRDLGPQLRKKTIPSSQIFTIDGLNIKDAKDWGPHSTGKPIGKLLDDLWGEADAEPKKFSEFLYERSTTDKITLPFRALQNFFDMWNAHTNSDGNEGIAEFLKIAIENPAEEAYTVAVMGGEGSDSHGERHIEISSPPGDVAPSPRLTGVIHTGLADVRIKWARRFDFMWRQEVTDGSGRFNYHSAAPELLLALDLADWCRSRFVLVNNLRLTQRTLGLVWTEYEKIGVVIPWPMKEIPKCPSDWIKKCDKWKTCLNKYSNGDPKEEEILKAWCTFNSDISNSQSGRRRGLEAHLKAVKNEPDFAVFGSDLLGFNLDLHKRVLAALGGEGTTNWDKLVRKHARKSREPETQFAPYWPTFTPEHGKEPEPSDIEKMQEAIGKMRGKP